jgi:hypothetical protein
MERDGKGHCDADKTGADARMLTTGIGINNDHGGSIRKEHGGKHNGSIRPRRANQRELDCVASSLALTSPEPPRRQRRAWIPVARRRWPMARCGWIIKDDSEQMDANRICDRTPADETYQKDIITYIIIPRGSMEELMKYEVADGYMAIMTRVAETAIRTNLTRRSLALTSPEPLRRRRRACTPVARR